MYYELSFVKTKIKEGANKHEVKEVSTTMQIPNTIKFEYRERLLHATPHEKYLASLYNCSVEYTDPNMHFSIRYVLKVKVHHDAWNDFTGTRTGKASVEIWKPLLT